MIKVSLIALFLVAIIENVNCRRSTFCPKVEPMEGFQWGPFLGNWHLWLANTEFVDVGDRCYKNNHTLLPGNKLQMEQSWFLQSGEVVNFTIIRDISKPGQVYYDEDETLLGFFGEKRTGKARTYSTTIYTDYTNVQARFICTELKHFWYTEARINYYISIRNRNFDSVSKIAPILNQFKKIGANLNRIEFLKNDLTCNN